MSHIAACCNALEHVADPELSAAIVQVVELFRTFMDCVFAARPVILQRRMSWQAADWCVHGNVCKWMCCVADVADLQQSFLAYVVKCCQTILLARHALLVAMVMKVLTGRFGVLGRAGSRCRTRLPEQSVATQMWGFAESNVIKLHLKQPDRLTGLTLKIGQAIGPAMVNARVRASDTEPGAGFEQQSLAVVSRPDVLSWTLTRAANLPAPKKYRCGWGMFIMAPSSSCKLHAILMHFRFRFVSQAPVFCLWSRHDAAMHGNAILQWRWSLPLE